MEAIQSSVNMTFVVCFPPVVGTPDSTSPFLTSCPQDIAVANNGQNFVLVTWDAPTAFDDSGVINQLSGPATTSQFYQAGTSNTISYILYDPSGNSVTCSFSVTVAGKFVFSIFSPDHM